MSNSATAPQANRSRLRLTLRLVSAAILVAGLGFWAGKGANTGWSKDQVPIKQTDEVTGIEFVTYEKRFVPGVEFLAVSVGLAAGLFVISLLVPRKTTTPVS